jgi:RNA polymerase sigma factor (sigma-70 family)
MRSDTVLGRRHGDLVPAQLLRLASDERLLAQVHAGSERAFEALFDRHHRPVLAFCQHMLGSRDEAEDVVQLTFLAAHRDLIRGEPPFALRPWLYGIARHRCLSVLRARREHPVEELPEPATDHLDTEIAMRDDLRAILADIARLPDDQRAALVLAELGDVSYDEIARILVCPRTKVKALVFQARSSLTAARAARETPCAEIREQLATLRGSALLRATLRRHMRDCPGCRAFREQLRNQRRQLGLLLPAIPTVGLKRAVLGALFGPGAGAGGAAVTAGTLSAGGLATALVALAVPAGGITAAVRASRDGAQAAPMIALTAPGQAPDSAMPGRPRAMQAFAERDQKHASATVARRDRAQPREPLSQTEANGNGADKPALANTPAQAEQAKSPEAATASSEEPTADGHVTAANATAPPESSRADGLVTPARPNEPAEPPTAHDQPAPARPAEPAQSPQAAVPAEPPAANGRLSPATGAKPATPLEAPNPSQPAAAKADPTPATPAHPAKPLQAANPSQPAAAARPEPPSAKGQATAAALGAPANPGGGTGELTPAKPDRHAEPPLPATPEPAHRTDAGAKPPPTVAAAPGESGTASHAGNEHKPASG